jgi:predicted O-methyltransferase YrrM
VAKEFEDESLDFVFIDGNHAYEWVVQDIALWSKKVRKGGIIYGHDFDDYSHNRRWKEMHVIWAVDGWMKSYKIHPWFVLEGNKNKSWMYIKN